MDKIIMKKCSGICGKTLELNNINFKICKATKSGFRKQCKKCYGKGVPDHIIIENGIKYQICSGDCKLKLKICEDNFSRQNNKYLRQCKICIAKCKAEYKKKNKEEIKIRDKKYYEENKEEILIQHKEYKKENKEEIKVQNKEYYKENKEEILTRNKEYNSRPEVKIKRNEKQRKKRRWNIQERIHHNVSNLISKAIKSNGGKKQGSILDYLPYTIDEFKRHIESFFKLPGNEWMSWDNYGAYNKKHRKDPNDKSTWKWHIDHAKAHCKFKYTSMDDQEFKDCWALNNLQPLEGLANMSKGSR